MTLIALMLRWQIDSTEESYPLYPVLESIVQLIQMLVLDGQNLFGSYRFIWIHMDQHPS